MTPLLDKIVIAALGCREQMPDAVRIRQRGVLRLKGERWLPFTAAQTISARAVGFRWTARIRVAPFVVVRVVDAFEGGHGRLDARLWGLIPMARVRGPSVDRGEALRYLAELPWCPTAYVANNSLAFESVAEDQLRVTAQVEGALATVELTVDGAGDVVKAFAASRPRAEGRSLVERPWYGEFADHGNVGGLRIPRRAAVYWILEDGPQEVFRCEITGMEFS